ncbi:antibiotic biosynthesis monooxygenase [Erwinia psidii]|uniref:putative quinol monooxygenase n=1 Tax=Erwinia psidii TaxID=69224 RepID=UPI00226B300D|nr:putative quinol monooxygenase [Erwinia psidii]MCX8960953.1 antibiotic biosynthesis monooxygenase [Erwinia psidii]MCX8964804.1 antibiotic biosynthesis monooxygenase [Erwinia psidii]
MLTVIAEICVRPGRRSAVIEEIEKLIPLVLQEEGCGQYLPLVDHIAQIPWKQHSPDSIFMIEHWDSMRHLEEHQQSPHMEKHRSLIKDDVVEVKIFVLEATRQ